MSHCFYLLITWWRINSTPRPTLKLYREVGLNLDGKEWTRAHPPLRNTLPSFVRLKLFFGTVLWVFSKWNPSQKEHSRSPNFWLKLPREGQRPLLGAGIRWPR